jgi:hypothetical protein
VSRSQEDLSSVAVVWNLGVGTRRPIVDSLSHYVWRRVVVTAVILPPEYRMRTADAPFTCIGEANLDMLWIVNRLSIPSSLFSVRPDVLLAADRVEPMDLESSFEYCVACCLVTDSM